MTATTIDMDTAEGMYAHLSTLPTANLREIASRELWAGNALMLSTADAILIQRGEAA